MPFIGGYTSNAKVWSELPFPEAIGNVENVKKWVSKGDWRSFVLGNDGKMYMGGTWTAVFGGGQALNGYKFVEFTYGVDLTEGEKIIDIASISQDSCMMLTNNGRLFGFGPACYIGINNTASEFITNRLISSNTINGKKLVQIEAGANFYIAVDEDGNVYGTGNNTFGTLGRWKGSDRTPSSRYRSAFEWVACPELEI